MFRRHHVLASLSVALVTAVTTAGCKDDVQATPRVVFDSEVKPGTHSPKDCPHTGPWFTIGSFGNPALGHVDPMDNGSPLKVPVVPVDDGGDDQQGKVSITCSVTADGDNFNVNAQAVLTGATGGAVTISGTFARAGDQKNITVRMTKGGETFTATDCVATYDLTLGHAVAAGRVWAQVDCPNAAQPSAQQTCESKAQFRFENCSQ